ncbi:MAG: PD-(D/E)XK motif protein [Solirubrobacteraceae bacterium]
MTAENTPDRLPTWSRIQDILREGAPQAIVLDGHPAVQLVVDGEHGVLSLRCETPADVSIEEFDNLDQLEVSESVADDTRWLEIRTHHSDLFPFFVAFAGTVADDIQLEGMSVRTALQRSLRLFRRLVRDVPLLAPERQLGLLGELWVLERLVRSRGAAAMKSWLGPDAEAHDFRFDDIELEVKTTRRQQRRHTINGLDQLDRSPGAELFIVSLQFASAGPADAGASLAEAIGDLRRLLASLDQDAAAFDAVLIDRFDLLPHTEHRYADRLKLRTEPRLIRVEDRTPRLLRSDVLAAAHDDMQRVVDADYTLDCEGLGVPDGSDEFLTVIPRP